MTIIIPTRRKFVTGAAAMAAYSALPAPAQSQVGFGGMIPGPGRGASSPPPAVAYVAGGSAQGGSPGVTGLNLTGANLIVVAVTEGVIGAEAVTDNSSNTYILAATVDNSSNRVQLWYCYNPTVTSSHDVFLNGAYSGISVAAYSGLTATAPIVDVYSSNASDAATSLTSGSGTITPTQNNELIIATIGPWSEDGAGAGYSVGGGFTIRTSIQPASGNAAGAAIADLLQTTAAGVNPSWSGWGGSNGPRVGGTLVAFKT